MDRAEALLELVKKKTDRDYEAFCEALHETKQTFIVHNYLVTESKFKPVKVFVTTQLHIKFRLK